MFSRLFQSDLKPLRALLLAGAASLALSACATSPMTTGSIGDTGASAMPANKQAAALAKLEQHYKKNPGDRSTIFYYASALRANGQSAQAVAVLENGVMKFKNDREMLVAFAKALSASGQFDRALNVIDRAIDPATPGWNELMVKGAILDQSGRNKEARTFYAQAQKIAPDQAGIRANLGLSYAMTNELDKAEKELRAAVSMRGANSQIRQNLALIVGLQGRFDESRTLFAAELPADGVEANMAYIRSLLTQQNRWDLVKKQG
ncbi:tetratricopeptide repeat protein [Devosia sp. ZB163]|uniref:tetratricopeptide repeat protein n=1 Tax=Devosia sp. ZB163 TaxID=3025938 RepID=UPI002362FE12|nr:tetratricopeptide repeat protein [Devosia sp. ZB163]MDC9823231.1 tetratricopeptide repeat protein [Devosia sp. ZB163]